MRRTVAHFFVVPPAALPTVEAAARRKGRAWFGETAIERALGATCTDVREFAREGLMALWGLFYLHERGEVASPHPLFQAPLAVSVSDALRAQGRRTTQATLAFGASERADLLRATSAALPTETDLREYFEEKSREPSAEEEAEWLREMSPAERQFFEREVGTTPPGETAEPRLGDDESMRELVADCLGGFHWLHECLGRVERGSLGLLVVRAARRRRTRWLTVHFRARA